MTKLETKLAEVVRASKPESFSEQSISLQAASLREARHNQWREMSNKLAGVCAQSNPRFNRVHWLAYVNGECGPGGGKVKTDA